MWALAAASPGSQGRLHHLLCPSGQGPLPAPQESLLGQQPARIKGEPVLGCQQQGSAGL